MTSDRCKCGHWKHFHRIVDGESIDCGRCECGCYVVREVRF